MLSRSRIVELLISYPAWTLDGKSLVRELKFKDFQDAVDFVNRVAQVAESVNHHPDLHLTSYNRVRLELSTHSAGGVTEKDFDLAGRIDRILTKAAA